MSAPGDCLIVLVALYIDFLSVLIGHQLSIDCLQSMLIASTPRSCQLLVIHISIDWCLVRIFVTRILFLVDYLLLARL